MDELNRTTTYLRLHEEAAIDLNYDRAFEVRQICGGVQLVFVRRKLVTDDSEQQRRCQRTPQTFLMAWRERPWRVGASEVAMHS
jgi:hypothetical protein